MSLDLWNRLATPPVSALKKITGGRLSGKSDINPQWRMQRLTEEFGPCGVGWKYTIDKLWTEPGTDGVVFAFALISLYTLAGDEWADPIPGIGGHKLVEDETKGLHNNDEAFKMAVTDALSVAMKALGVAAEVYLGNFDGSKYRGVPPPPGNPPPGNAPSGPFRHPTEKQLKRLFAISKSHGWDEEAIHAYTLATWGVANTKALSIEQYNALCGDAEQGIAGVLEGPPPAVTSDQERYDAKARTVIEAATDWITFKPAVTKMAHGYIEKQLDFADVGKLCSEKMMVLVAAAAESGDEPDVLLEHVSTWAHFGPDQRAQLRTHIAAVTAETGVDTTSEVG